MLGELTTDVPAPHLANPTREASGRAEEEVYNLSTPMTGAHQPIPFTNEDLRGLHLPHDDALVISATIANFNI